MEIVLAALVAAGVAVAVVLLVHRPGSARLAAGTLAGTASGDAGAGAQTPGTSAARRDDLTTARPGGTSS